jgi:excisionase family DNA binding protein
MTPLQKGQKVSDALARLRQAASPQGIIIEGVKLYTYEETAQLLKVSKRTVQTYYWQGKITGRKIGRRIYILAESITEFIRKGTANPD